MGDSPNYSESDSILEKAKTNFWLNPKVEVREATLYVEGGKTLSRGLFAKEKIHEGEVIDCGLDEDTLVMTREEIENYCGLASEKRNMINFSYMLDDDVYATIKEPGDDPTLFYNHSCNPNSWYDNKSDGKEIMVARRDIDVGEEITCHYGTFETEMSFHAGMVCKCGSNNCSGTFTGLNYRDPEFLKVYRCRLSPYINRLSSGLSWYKPYLHLKKSRVGSKAKGVFTSKPVQKGEVVLSWSGKVVHVSQLSKCSDLEKHFSLQIEEEFYQIPDSSKPRELPDFINHSCSPNCGMLNSTHLVAIVDIGPGEELTYDYAMTTANSQENQCDNFKCECGTESCRGWVRGDDWNKRDLQLKYFEFFSPFIKRKLSTGASCNPSNSKVKRLKVEAPSFTTLRDPEPTLTSSDEELG
mmetsp:Transcript_6521/g.8835  ORF Transcript_6521/g.8835 Transcript_6521/m.8835 type:complete len:412 (+) Transcript_6521:155-1390(+)